MCARGESRRGAVGRFTVCYWLAQVRQWVSQRRTLSPGVGRLRPGLYAKNHPGRYGASILCARAGCAGPHPQHAGQLSAYCLGHGSGRHGTTGGTGARASTGAQSSPRGATRSATGQARGVCARGAEGAPSPFVSRAGSRTPVAVGRWCRAFGGRRWAGLAFVCVGAKGRGMGSGGEKGAGAQARVR